MIWKVTNIRLHEKSVIFPRIILIAEKMDTHEIYFE